MRIELIKSIKGLAHFPGDVIETTDEKGRAWCEAGHAIPAKQEVETAGSKAKTEKATKK